jgi:hypothetical protein
MYLVLTDAIILVPKLATRGDSCGIDRHCSAIGIPCNNVDVATSMLTTWVAMRSQVALQGGCQYLTVKIAVSFGNKGDASKVPVAFVEIATHSTG